MAFSDPRYFALLAAVVILVSALSSLSARLFVVVAVSMAFYAALNPAHWYLLPAVGLIAYVGGRCIGSNTPGWGRTCCFLVSVILTLAPLLVFKYAAPIRTVLSHDASPTSVWTTFESLPVGLSFFTFLAIGYLIEVFVGNIEAERRPLRFATFMCFFPHLTAGPIERARNLLPQLQSIGSFDYMRAVSGLRAVLIGTFMKVVIADRLAPVVDMVYADPHRHGALDLTLATVYFSFQVYADFAGYSLIAIGSARLLGVELIKNFDTPYLSQSLPEYWRRWHISLSSWFRDYVFIPLQFQVRRSGGLGLVMALVFTFVLVGMWHGAGPKYALFGLIHGMLVSFSTLTLARRTKLWRSVGIPEIGLRLSRTLVTFAIVSLTFVLFRADDLDDAAWIYRSMLNWTEAPRQVPLAVPTMLISMVVIGDIAAAYGSKFVAISRPVRWLFYYALSAGVMAVFVANELKTTPVATHFIYFRF